MGTTEPLESHGFYFARRIIVASEKAGFVTPEPFQPLRMDHATTPAERELIQLQKDAVDMIAIYKMQGLVVPFVFDHTQDVWNIDRD